MKRAWWMFAVLLAAGWRIASQEAAAQYGSQEEKPAAQLPANSNQWLNSPPIALGSLAGKGVVLYFYEEGCPKARGRWPELLETARKFDGQPVMFIAVNSGNSARSVASYCRDQKVSWPVIVDEDRTLERQLLPREVSLQNIYQAVAITPNGQAQRTGSDFDSAAQLAVQGAEWKVDPKAMPAELKSAWLAVELGAYSQAGPAIRKSLKSPKPEVKSAAEKLDAAVQKQIETLAAEAAKQQSDGNTWAAYQTYKRINSTFSGFTIDESIASEQRELELDPTVVTEQKAFSALEAAKKVGSKGNAAAVRRAKGMLERLVSEQPDTAAAEEAKTLLLEAAAVKQVGDRK